MTRTERNQYPAALLKDRHSRSGLTKAETDRKHGAGAGNWGSHAQEGEFERQADDDATGMFDMDDNDNDEVMPLKTPQQTKRKDSAADDEEGQVINKDMMKEAVATSPADSVHSSSSQNDGKRPGQGRRMSNVSDEERERARVYREGVMAGGGPVNLANIARTSFGVASPPNGNGFASLAGTSPTKTKAVA